MLSSFLVRSDVKIRGAGFDQWAVWNYKAGVISRSCLGRTDPKIVSVIMLVTMALLFAVCTFGWILCLPPQAARRELKILRKNQDTFYYRHLPVFMSISCTIFFNFISVCWRRTKKISWNDRERNEVLHGDKGERNIVYKLERKKANWIGYIWRGNCFLKHVIEEKIEGKIDVTRRRGRSKQLLDDFEENRGLSKLKEKRIDRTVWRTRFGSKADYMMTTTMMMLMLVMMAIIIIIIIIIQYVCLLSQAFLPGTSLEPAVIPTTQASSFTLQYFPYYVWCFKYSCLL